ncbi:MAG: cell division protein FtsA [Candidatus Blackburnbacteria bacterium]|nr:cell division protein FtsA [Candidatus Blackburnbacteria bacterium]
MAKTRVIAGIDLGSSKVATLIAQYNEEEDKISVVGVSQVSSKGIRKGQVVDIEEASGSIIDSVERAERMAGYSVDRAFVTIGGGHIESQNSHGVVAVSDPSGEIGDSDVERVIDAARAVSLPESREILHVVPKEYKVDGETQVKDPVGMSGVRLEVDTHLVTGSTTAVKNIQKCASEVGITAEGIVFSGLAASYSALTDTERELGVILVDFGGGTTSVTAFVEGALAYSSVLPIGGKNVTNDLAAGLRVSLESAEKIKISLGEAARRKKEEDEEKDELELGALGLEEGGKKISRKTLTEGIIRPRLNEIFTMVGMGLGESKVLGKTPSGVVITGGGALTVGALESVKRMLSLPARIGKPVGVSGLIDEIEDPSFAGAVGLVLYGARLETGGREKRFVSFNFLSKFDQIQVKGLIGHITDVVKKILP